MYQVKNSKTSSLIAQRHVYLVAVILSLLMIFQSSSLVDGELKINLNKVIVFTFNYFVWAAAIPFLFQFISDIDWPNKKRSKVIKWLGIALFISLIQLIISNLLFYSTILIFYKSAIADPLPHFIAVLPRAYLSRVIDMTVIVFLIKGLDNNRKLNAQKVAVAELENELNSSKLEALKMQLNPHFLFNSLHAIHSLIGYENEKARSMLLKISNLLRRILELSDQQTIPLSDELSYLKDYLDIEQERFHDRLEVIYTIEDQLLETQVPSLILQPLAENALKHGIAPSESNGQIVITIKTVAEQRLNIIVLNTVDGQSDKSNSTQIGLKNLRNRLVHLYGEEFSIDIQQTSNSFQVSLNLPNHQNGY